MRQRFLNPQTGTEVDEPMGQERSIRGFADKTPARPVMRPGSRPTAHHPHRKEFRVPKGGQPEPDVKPARPPKFDGEESSISDKTPLRPIPKMKFPDNLKEQMPIASNLPRRLPRGQSVKDVYDKQESVSHDGEESAAHEAKESKAFEKKEHRRK